MKIKMKSILTILLIFSLTYVVYFFKNVEHYDNKKKSSTYSQKEGSSKYYGWGLADLSKPKPKRKPIPSNPIPFPPIPDSGGSIMCPKCNTVVINDYRQGCNTCDISKHPGISNYVLKSSIPPQPDMDNYILKKLLPPMPDMSKYILKSDIPPCDCNVDMSEYVHKSHIPKSKCGNYMKQVYDIESHPDFYKYELKPQFKASKKNGVCSDKLPGYVGGSYSSYN